MRKVVFECVGNALLFSLMGLAFMFPFSRYEGSVFASGFSFDVHLSPFMVALLAFLVLYAVVRHAFVKRNVPTRRAIWSWWPTTSGSSSCRAGR